MAQRPLWRGHLRLALVSCPVALYSARHDRNAIRFNLINPETGNRIRMVTQDAETGQELSRRDLVKGYEFKKDHYILLSDDDLDSVKVDSSSMMSVEKFVEADSIDPLYFDASYYLAPDGHAGEDVYAVLRQAIEKTGRVALSRVVIGGRERTIAIRIMEGGLAAQTLYEQRDLNSAADLFSNAASTTTDPEMVQLAVQLIDRQTGRYDPADLEDRYATRLRAMIDAKLAGEGLDVEPPEPDRSNVVDLMAALRRSLQEEQSPDAPAPKPASTAKTASEKKGQADKAPSQPKPPRKRAAAQAARRTVRKSA